jgi:hypothetical protein
MDKQTYEQMREVGRRNLDHALEDMCTDPDCEIHNPDVAMAEEVIDLTDLAMYVAGYLAGAAAMGDQYDSVKGNLRDEVKQMIEPQEGQ